MELVFEYAETVGTGTQPVGFHSPDNVVQVLYVDSTDNGRIWGTVAPTPYGVWDPLTWSDPHLAARDEDVEHFRLRWVPSTDLVAVWRTPWTSERHRLSVYILQRDVTNNLESGSFRLRRGDPVVSLSLTLQNPSRKVADEYDALALPGSRITLAFSTGDSMPIPLGAYFIDDSEMNVLDPAVNINARNAAGKLLKDQTFGDSGSYSWRNLQTLIEDILEAANVPEYSVESTAENRSITYPANRTIYQGLQDLLTSLPQWRIEETMLGEIVIGSSTFADFPSPETYTFHEGEDCFSRRIRRDDKDVWSQVCVHDRDFNIAVYEDVDFILDWNLPQGKILYVEVPDGTSQSDAESYAAAIATRAGDVGEVRTFIGPFRPQLLPGDEATIITEGGNRQIGIITEISHTIGKDGYRTEFTVDSGGVIGKPMISEFIAEIAGRQNVSVSQLLPPTSASISPNSADFDLFDPADVTTTITWNDAASVTGVSGEGITTTDWDVTGDTLTINQAFLSTFTAPDTLVFTISFDVGSAATLTVDVIDTTP